MGVRDDRDHSAGQRQLDVTPDQWCVPLILRIHRDPGISEHRLGPRGGDREVPAPVVELPDRVGSGLGRRSGRRIGCLRKRIAKVPEASLRLLTLRLFVGESGQAARAPVDDVLAPVDQAPFVQVNKHLAHRPTEFIVEREARAIPVTRRADGLELLENGPAGLVHMVPNRRDETVSTQVVARASFGGERTLDHVLRGDARMVGTGHPERSRALHAPPTDQHVLDGGVETMPHVQHRRHVGRRNHDHVGIRSVLQYPTRGHMEVSALLPLGIAGGFDRLRVQPGCQLFGHVNSDQYGCRGRDSLEARKMASPR